MQHQFNLGSAIQPPPFVPAKDPDAPLYASVDGVAAALSNEEAAFQRFGVDGAQVMTHQVLQCLDQCRPFRSIDEHIAHVIRQVPGLSDPARARAGLEALANNGMLVSDAEYLADFEHATAETAPLAGLCIRACDRPDQVQALLTSMAEHESRRGTSHPVWLFDDSRDAGARQRNAELLADHGRDTGVATRLIDPDAGDKMAARLAEAIPECADAARELLVQSDTTGGGRNWNLALLLTAGRKLALFDEDFRLPLKSLADASEGMNPDPRLNRELKFFDTLEQALAAGEEPEWDPLALHLDCAGQPLGATTSLPGLGFDRQQLRGLTLRDLAATDGSARVLTTYNGVRGASGSLAVPWLYTQDAATRAELTRDRDAYLRNVEAQSIWRGFDVAHPMAQDYMTPFAIDNSVLMPCTIPGGRMEDALFDTLVRFCHPDSVALHLPLTVGHAQETARKRSEATRRALTPHAIEFAYELLELQARNVHSADPVQRLQHAAASLEDLAAASPARRLDQLREYINYVRTDAIAAMQKQLIAAPEAPVYWQADVREIIAANAKAMVTKEPPRLGGWPADSDAEGCAALLAEDFRRIARWLRVWPAMWQYAREQGDALIESL